MNIPPIQPTGGPPPQPGDGSVRERVQHALSSLQENLSLLQIAFATHDSPGHIDNLLQQLQPSIQVLVQLAGRQPPVMSQNEIDVVKDLNTQFQLAQLEPQSASPTAAAAIQGSSATLAHLFAAETAGIPEPNTSALQAVNFLSALTEALGHHLKTKSKDSEQIILSMQHPLKELEHLSSSGILSPAQSEALSALSTNYNSHIKTADLAAPQALDQFQTALQTLTQLLTS